MPGWLSRWARHAGRVPGIPLVLLTLLLQPGSTLAQQRFQRFENSRTRNATERAVRAQIPGAGLDLVGIGKWAALAASVGSGAYGLVAHFDANDKFDRLQRICEADPDRCQNRTPSGAYVDNELEALYQDVLALDRVAKYALIGSQIAIAGSVILFILDLRESEMPPNVPYDPPGFRVVPKSGGAQLQWSMPAPRW